MTERNQFIVLVNIQQKKTINFSDKCTMQKTQLTFLGNVQQKGHNWPFEQIYNRKDPINLSDKFIGERTQLTFLANVQQKMTQQKFNQILEGHLTTRS